MGDEKIREGVQNVNTVQYNQKGNQWKISNSLHDDENKDKVDTNYHRRLGGDTLQSCRHRNEEEHVEGGCVKLGGQFRRCVGRIPLRFCTFGT